MQMNAGAIAIAISMAVLMFYSGMLFDSALLRDQFGRGKLSGFGGVVFANYLVIPVLTLCVVWFLSFPPALNLVLLTMAMLPCAPLVPALVSITGEPPEQSLFLFLCMSMLNVVMIPLLLAVVSISWIGGSEIGTSGGEGAAATRYFISIYGPMSLGAAIRLFAPALAGRCVLLLRRMMPAMMMLTTAIFVFSYRDELLSLGLREIGALIIFESICVAVGLAFSRCVANGKVTSVLLCTLRNFAMGIAFTTIVFPHTAAPSRMMMFTGLICVGTAIWLSIKSRMSSLKTEPALKQ